MLVLYGNSVLSDFRKLRLLERLRSVAPGIVDIGSRYVHLVAAQTELSPDERAHLEGLLAYGPRHVAESREGRTCLVVPRVGTTSPWSSKATEIARVCGLSQVTRIERATAYYVPGGEALSSEAWSAVKGLLHDRMTQEVLDDVAACDVLFRTESPRPLERIELGEDPRDALGAANRQLGLALSPSEIEYLEKSFATLGRDPTDVELMMFAQMNSEHCRHKIFKADWVIDGREAKRSLFAMIQNTFTHSPQGVVSAYHDNAAVMTGYASARFWPDADGTYGRVYEDAPILMKVETHNHPTAISPFAGAATGSGGEIRDEGATGRGSKPKVGLSGFSVSSLRLPGAERPWESDNGKPLHIESALQIMLEGPIGAAAFNNEFGRPNVCGYFRTFEQWVEGPDGPVLRGYHKPIMLAGGLGTIRPALVDKKKFGAGTLLVVLGGPAMLIGLGGGAASSMAQGQSSAALDFASVQRGNPEIQRRCQEVINRCCALGEDSPIQSIHDVGAGGLSNAFPELVNDAGRGGQFELREIPNAEPGLSPLEIWCNEAQERYVIALDPARLSLFEKFCRTERAPFAVVGKVTHEPQLVLADAQLLSTPIDLPLRVLLGNPPKTTRSFQTLSLTRADLDLDGVELAEAVRRVLTLPAVADKTFLITIGDRTVTGLVSRDQMVGPWQVPVADAAVTLADFDGFAGEAMALGERTPLALVDSAAAARMAVGEVITNLCCAPVAELGDIKLSANWMAAAGIGQEDQALFEAVRAVGEELCPALGIAIPVGKDSMSMSTRWRQDGTDRLVVSPLSLVVTGFARCYDVRRAVTPQLRTDAGDTRLLLIDLGRGRLGGSALAQVYGQVGSEGPDVDAPELLAAFFSGVQALLREGLVLAYHDRSDGGLLATLCEMAFAGHAGVTVDLGVLPLGPLNAIFNEELGAVLQIATADHERVARLLEASGLKLGVNVFALGTLNSESKVRFERSGSVLFEQGLSDLRRAWSDTTYRMQTLRDDPDCAQQEYDSNCDFASPGLSPRVTFEVDETAVTPTYRGVRPKVAIVREQGVNGHVEMAAAFDRAGFAAVDVHMSELLSGERSLSDFKGLVACGGFSYGDVLGAGGGWAKSVLFSPRARAEFAEFFQREDVFSLGICNGCQMMSALAELIPGSEHWPRFVRNRSEQFEARLSLVEVLETPSIFLQGMVGSRLPVAVAHGEGRAEFAAGVDPAKVAACLRFVDGDGRPAARYPDNPNGSPAGITGLCSADGRATIMMPHPERVFRTAQLSWAPRDWPEASPWLRMFQNARRWLA